MSNAHKIIPINEDGQRKSKLNMAFGTSEMQVNGQNKIEGAHLCHVAITMLGTPRKLYPSVRMTEEIPS